MAAPVIQFKRGAFVNLPALRTGEPGFTTDKYDLYVGLSSETSTNKFFGSSRYWQREVSGTQGSGLNLVNGAGNKVVTFTVPENSSGIATYKFPTSYTNGNFLKVSSDGTLSWDTLSGSNGTFTNSTLSGITTISGTLNVSANSSFSGITTISNVDINDGTIDGVVIGGTNPDAGYFTLVDTGELISDYSNIGFSTATDFYIDSTRVLYNDGAGITLAGIQTIDATTKATLETILAFDPNNFSSLNVVGIATIGGLLDANGGATIDNVRIGVANDNEIDTSTGILILDSAAGQTTIDDNLAITGIATVTGAFVANGNVTLGDASGDIIVVKGTTSFEQSLVGTISTATRATTVDTTTAATGTFYPALLTSSTGTTSAVVNVDAGISYVSNTDTLTLTGDLAVNGGDLTTTAATATVFNANATTVSAFGAGTNVVLSAATGITTVRNKLTVGGNLEIDGNAIQASDGNTNITLTSNTLTTFAGDIRVNGNDIQASDGNVNITMTSNTLTEVKGDLKVTGNDIQSSTATAITLSGADVTVAGDITIGGNDIKASNGTTALTLSTTGAVSTANDLTVTGNLYVNGSTTQVNTAALTVEDRTIDLGIVNGSTPASTTTWDLGVLFNYNSGGAKKSAVIWEHSDTRFKFASVIGSDTDGTDANTPQLTVTTFAPIEIGSLWVTDCSGTSQVISCTGSTRYLENITVDAGTF